MAALLTEQISVHQNSAVMRFVHRGRDRRAWVGAGSDYESDSGGVLAALLEPEVVPLVVEFR
jgi:hypothetical protein